MFHKACGRLLVVTFFFSFLFFFLYIWMKEQKILLRKLRKSLIDISMLMYDLIY